jgi:hypothetical protein
MRFRKLEPANIDRVEEQQERVGKKIVDIFCRVVQRRAHMKIEFEQHKSCEGYSINKKKNRHHLIFLFQRFYNIFVKYISNIISMYYNNNKCM